MMMPKPTPEQYKNKGNRLLQIDYQWHFPEEEYLAENLPIDVEDEKTLWNYNWKYAACGTVCPLADEDKGGCTMILIVNQTEKAVKDLHAFINTMNRDNKFSGGRVAMHFGEPTGYRDVTAKQGDNVIWKGFVSTGQFEVDRNVGNYAMFTSQSPQGFVAMREAHACARYGYCALLDHVRSELEVGPNLKLVTVTGLGDPQFYDVYNCPDDLSTRFSLFHDTIEVARCHLSYKSADDEPAMGPTIEMIEARRDQRAKSYVPLLWFWVRSFIEDNFTLECLNEAAAPSSHVVIQATMVDNTVIDTKLDGAVVTDKEFYYDYVGFNAWQTKYLNCWSPGRPDGEEVNLYIPLLSREERAQRTSYSLSKDFLEWKVQNIGRRPCWACGNVTYRTLRCGQCKKVHYCSSECQKMDWKCRHKHVCNKSRVELKQVLIQKGLMQP